MAKYALTEAGVASKISEIYALSNTALEAEAAAIKSDFAGWMDDNFNLTTDQGTFISGMYSRVTEYYGEICSVAFLNHLDIDFVYPSPPVGAISKWVESEDKAVVRTTPPTGGGGGGWLVTGSLKFTVGYIIA